MKRLSEKHFEMAKSTFPFRLVTTANLKEATNQMKFSVHNENGEIKANMFGPYDVFMSSRSAVSFTVLHTAVNERRKAESGNHFSFAGRLKN
jgi:hypothetical protein